MNFWENIAQETNLMNQELHNKIGEILKSQIFIFPDSPMSKKAQCLFMSLFHKHAIVTNDINLIMKSIANSTIFVFSSEITAWENALLLMNAGINWLKIFFPKNFQFLLNLHLKKPTFYSLTDFLSYYNSNKLYIYETNSNINKCELVYEKLYDEESKKIFLRLLSKRFIRCCFYLDIYNFGSQYFDEFLNFTNDEVFFDCGAYIGDTVEMFVSKVKNYKAIYAFEPDVKQFIKLVKSTSKYCNVNCMNVGIGKKFEVSNFYIKNLADSHFERDPKDNISAAVPQVIIPGNSINVIPSFVKMDIEGSEMAALEGLSEILSHYPKLAICIYHKPNDVWEIPYYIVTNYPKYRLCMRHYSSNTSESVCYAAI